MIVRPEHVCGEVAVKRVSALSGAGTETVVAAVRKVGDVDVQRRLEENRAHRLQMRSCCPEPPAPWSELKTFPRTICLESIAASIFVVMLGDFKIK